MGEFFALACGLVWAFAVIFFKKSGETVSPFTLNLFRVTLSSALLAVTLTIMDRPLWGQAPLKDYLIPESLWLSPCLEKKGTSTSQYARRSVPLHVCD